MLNLQAHTNLITNSRYLVKRFLREKLMKCVQGVSSNCILDVGCGEKPYTKFFPNSKYYLGIDRRSSSADVKAIGEYLPFNGATFDTALCTQVLEHVEHSEKVLTELNRVLTDNGVLILSTHGIWTEAHEPTDYWRWTLQGLEKIFEEADFQITESYSMDPSSSLLQIISLFIPRNLIGKFFQIGINLSSIVFKQLRNKAPKIYILHIIKARKKHITD